MDKDLDIKVGDLGVGGIVKRHSIPFCVMQCVDLTHLRYGNGQNTMGRKIIAIKISVARNHTYPGDSISVS